MTNYRSMYRYQFKEGHKVLYHGITNDLCIRDHELMEEHPTGHILQIGNRVTPAEADAWLKSKCSPTEPTKEVD